MGTSPTIRRVGRTAAVLAAIAFVILITILSARYSHTEAPPADDPSSAPLATSTPLTAERIEDFARRALAARLRAAKPAPPPPDLSSGGAESAPSPDASRPPGLAAPRPSAAAAGARVPSRRALESPLTPRGVRTARGARAGAAPDDQPASTPRGLPDPRDLRVPQLPPLDRFFPGAGSLETTRPAPSAARLDAPAAVTSGTGPATAPSFEERRVGLPDATAYALTRRPAPLQPVLYAGTAIPLTLAHGLSSDVPGPARAVVTRDVYDSLAHRRLVLPRGTLVLGHQSARSAAGDQRILIAWTALKLPDGTSYRLPKQPAGAADGTAGARGRVDNHWWSRFGSAVGLSLVGAGTQLSQPRGRTAVPGQGYAASEGQIVAQQLGLELGRLSQEMLRRGVNRAPTITLEPGQGMTLLLTRDLLFPLRSLRPIRPLRSIPSGLTPTPSPAAP